MVRLKSSYSRAEFGHLVGREDEIERKMGLGNEAMQECMVALSNTSGGVIFVGVQDDGMIVGRRRDQFVDDKIHEAALAARDVGRYQISEVDVVGKPIVAIAIERRTEGFSQTSNGRVLVRRGGRNVPLFGADLARFMSERALQRFEQTDSGIRIDDCDPELLTELATVSGWNVHAADLNVRLQEKGLALPSDNVTIAGALFLTDPRRALGQSKTVVDVRRFPADSGEYDRRLEFGGPLHYQVAQTTEFIIHELGSDVVVTGLYRHELPRLPEVVIREAVANAVAHRSYEAQGASTIVELRPDAVVVTSPGGFPEPVTVENLRQAQSARNQAVIDVLRRFHLAEDAGRGVDVMQDQMQEALLDPPRFEDLGGAVRVSLPLRGPITAQERAWVSDLDRRGDIAPADRLLLVHAARGERLTNARAREIVGVDRLEARQALHRLRDAGLVMQSGERGGASYFLVDDIAPPAAFRMSPTELENLVVVEARKGPLTNETVRRLTGLDRRQSLALLRRLVSSKRLRRIGERRGTRYLPRRRH